MTEEEQIRNDFLVKELARLKREISKVPSLPVAWIGKRSKEDAAGPFHVFIGGSPQRPGPEVIPASLSTLSEVTPGYELSSESKETERRLELAEWITHPDNPLTPRVLANRLWHYHFGTGIVDTPNDLGYMGGRPSHPELLDFLALKLKENNWQLKAMHKMIMTSKTYKQSSSWREDGGQVDADSRLLWRFPHHVVFLPKKSGMPSWPYPGNWTKVWVAPASGFIITCVTMYPPTSLWIIILLRPIAGLCIIRMPEPL